jgi:hypothetical protein
MVDFVEAIKRPLRTDPVTIVLGVLFTIFPPARPLVHGLGIELSRRTLNQNPHMPAFDDFVDIFLSGLIVFVIVILYFLPALLLLLAGLAVSFPLIVEIVRNLSVNPLVSIQMLMTWVIGGAFWGALTLLVALVAAIMAPVGVQLYAHDKRIGSAFAFGRISEVVGTFPYWVSWILMMGYGIVLIGLVGLLSIPAFNALSLVFLGVAMYLWWMTWYIVMAETVRESGVLGKKHPHHASSPKKWKSKKR